MSQFFSEYHKLISLYFSFFYSFVIYFPLLATSYASTGRCSHQRNYSTCPHEARVSPDILGKNLIPTVFEPGDYDRLDLRRDNHYKVSISILLLSLVLVNFELVTVVL